MDSTSVIAVLKDAAHIAGGLPVSCVGFTPDGHDLVSVSYMAESFDCPRFGGVYAAGTGARPLREQMQGFASEITALSGEPSIE
jgi:hypothetical protein